jgi:hypothetical protein
MKLYHEIFTPHSFSFLIRYFFEPGSAQDTTLLRVETIDGNEYVGKIISIDAQSIVLNTDLLGVITLRKSSIKSMTPVYGSQIKKGCFGLRIPNPLVISGNPNGYGLKKGEAYYQNVWVFFNQVSLWGHG